jgi:hypothetical protein
VLDKAPEALHPVKVRAARSAVACVVAGWLVACGLGLNGLGGVAGDGGAGGLDGAADVTSAEGGSDTSVAADTASSDTGVPLGDSGMAIADTGTAGDVVVIEASPVDGCVPKGPENCTNGIDDDCNGLVDCADPACTTQGYQCVAPAAMGWSIAAFSATSQAACPPGLMQKTGEVDPTSLPPAVCGCTCGIGTEPSCETGNMVGSGGPTAACPMGPANFPAADGGCVTNTLSVTAFIQATLPAPTGGTCAATPTVTKPSTGATSGEYCKGQPTFGAGCSGMDACALVPTGYQACVQHGGANMGCPTGYPTAHSIGTLQDTRGCGACTCGMPTATCADGTWNFYSSTNCMGLVGVAATINGTCDATNNPNTAEMFQSYMVVAPPTNVACAMPAQPLATGSVMLTAADTICCE